jgi:hypothetical protein
MLHLSFVQHFLSGLIFDLFMEKGCLTQHPLDGVIAPRVCCAKWEE